MEILIGLILLFALMGIRIVNQQTLAIVETMGRYSETLRPGLNWIAFPFQRVARTLPLRIVPHTCTVEIKTKDNMFVALPVTLMIQVDADRANEAYYRLADPYEQITTWVLNEMRSICSKMSLNEMFEDRTLIREKVAAELDEKMGEYGYLVQDVLIDQPTLTEDVQAAFNRVTIAVRDMEAAKQEGEAIRIKTTATAEAQGEAQKIRAKALAESRDIIAKGLQQSLEALSGLNAENAMWLLVETNRLDALREASGHGNLVLFDLGRLDNDQRALLPLLNGVKPESSESSKRSPAKSQAATGS